MTPASRVAEGAGAAAWEAEASRAILAQELGEHVLSLFHRGVDHRWLNDTRDDLLGTTRYLDT
jgi:hypothetical protein